MKLCRLILLTLCAFALISCGGAEERKAVYLEKAKASMDVGDLDKARIDLKNVLQIDPKDGPAHFYLGKVLERQQQYRKAFGEYLKAEELSPELLENHASLGRFYLVLLNDKDKAIEKIDFILSKEADNPDGLLLSAAVAIKEKDEDKAIKIVKDILSRDSNHVASVMFLSVVHLKSENFNAAIDLLDTVIKEEKNNEELNKLLASALMSNKNYDRAELLYKDFLGKNPDSSSSYNNLASFYNATGDFDKAEELFFASFDNKPDDADRQAILIKYIRAKKGDDEAIEQLKKLIAKYRGQGNLRLALAELYSLNKKKEEAIATYQDAIDEFFEEVTGVSARAGLATIYIADNDYEKAESIVEDALSISHNDPDLNYLYAKFAVIKKDYEKAIIALRIVTKEAPENIEAFFLLAEIFTIEGNKEQNISTLNSAYDKNRTNPEGLLQLSKYYTSRDLAKAEKIIDNYIAVKADDYEGLSVKAAILNRNKQNSEAYEIAQKLMELFPEKANGYLQSVPYLITTNDKTSTLSNLEKGYLTATDNRKILSLLTTLQVAEKQFDIVEKRLNAELISTPDDDELKMLLAKVYVTQKKFTLAEKTLKEVIGIAPSNEDSYLFLSSIYQNDKKFDDLKSILILGIANMPDSIKIAFKLASLYEREQNYTNAIGIYKNMNISHPDNVVVMNNLASMLSDYGDNKADLDMAKSFVDRLIESKQPVFLDTVGWVYYKLGDYKNAIDYLSQVVKSAPDINIFNYHLGMAYKMDGNKEQAEMYLEKSLSNGKPFKQKDLAEAALKEG